MRMTNSVNHGQRCPVVSQTSVVHELSMLTQLGYVKEKKKGVQLDHYWGQGLCSPSGPGLTVWLMSVAKCG